MSDFLAARFSRVWKNTLGGLLFFVSGSLPALAAYTWRDVAIGGGGYVSGLEFHPTTPGVLYARTDVGGAFRWDPARAIWLALNDDVGGLNNEFMQHGVLSVALDRSDPERVYLACGQYSASWAPAARLRSSIDRGATWTVTTLPFKLEGNQGGRGTGERLAVDPHDGTRLYLGTSIDGFWRSLDRGASWSRMANFTPISTTFVLCDPVTPGTLYAGAATLANATLWKSTDYGVNWSAVPGQPAGLIAMQGKLDAAGMLYLTFANGIGPNGVTAGAVWKWDGITWTNISPPAGQGGYCGLSLDPQTPGRLVVSTLNRWYPRDQILVSTNSGASWTGRLDGAPRDHSSAPWAASVTPHWITDVEIDPFDTGKAWFVTGFGVFSTDNLGVTGSLPAWTFNNRGLEETVPNALVSPASGPLLVSVIKDFDGYRHDSLDAPTATRHSPHKGGTNALDGAGAAPAVMVKTHGASGAISRDGGITWTDFPASPPTAVNGSGGIAVSADGNRLLWCPEESPAYFSTDDGASWTAATTGPGGTGVNLWPAADRVDSARFYVFDPVARRVHASGDGGVTFAQGATTLPTGSARVRSVPGISGHLWINCWANGLWRSTDFGATFTKVTTVEQGNQIGFGRASETGVYPALFIWGRIAGVTGFYRSDDTGASWQRINDSARQYGYIRDITGDPRVHGRVYLGTSGRGIIVGEIEAVARPTLAIYEDSLATGWNNWSWATVSMATVTPARRGNASISVTAGGYQAMYLNRAPMSTSGYSSLAFWIHGGTAGGQSLRLVALRNGVGQTGWNIPPPAAGTWTRIVVPLADLGVAGIPDLNGIWIQSRIGTAQPVFHVDDMALVSDGDGDWTPLNFETWRSRNFSATDLAIQSLSGPLADPDHDGVGNKLEWYLMRNPSLRESSPAAIFSLSGNALLNFEYIRRMEPGLATFSAEFSDDLVHWTLFSNQAGATILPVPLDAAGNAEKVTCTVPSGGRPRLFFRLK